MSVAKICPVVLLLLVPGPAFADTETDVSLGVKAKPVVRSAPRYPQSELRDGRQGWVKLSYVVDTEGQIVDPVVQDSSGSSAFEKAALRTVEDWRYEPATWNGVPVQQCQTEVMISFAIEGEETLVTAMFHRRYRRIRNAIEEGDLGKASELIASAREKLKLSLAERTWLWVAVARIEALRGNPDAQLRALRKATEGSGRWIDRKIYPNLLLVRTSLEMQKSNWSTAMQTHRRLVELSPDLPQMEQVNRNIETIRAAIDGEDIFAVPGRIGDKEDCVDCATNWHYDPLRRNFSIAELDGSLKNIEFRCDWRRVVTEAEEGMTWQLPEHYGDCSVVVFGEPGTTFKFLEMPTA